MATGAAGGLLLVAPGTAEAATLPTLRIGMKGSAVTTLQSRLSSHGYWLGAVDGSFGNLTQQAVYAVQKAAGVSRDGVVGPITWGKVNAGVRPTWRTKSGNIIEVDKPHQLLKVIRGGKLTYIVNTSTGSEQRYYSSGAWHTAHTPTGKWSVKFSVNGVDTGPLGKLYRPRYFTWQGHAVHGEWFDVPPYPASHGCCRISNPAMDMVWAKGYMPIGSIVYVY